MIPQSVEPQLSLFGALDVHHELLRFAWRASLIPGARLHVRAAERSIPVAREGQVLRGSEE
eukprot:13443276-Heterocapsa_arctica.AAC.1